MSRGATFVRFYPSDWRSGCIGLSLEEEGLYARICAHFYETGNRLSLDDDVARCSIGGLDIRKYRRVRDGLISKGKLHECQDGYTVPRAELELARARSAIEGDQAKEVVRVAAARVGHGMEHQNGGTALANQQEPRQDAVTSSGLAIDVSDKSEQSRKEVCQKTKSFLRATKEPVANSQDKSVSVSCASANPNSDNPKPNSDMPEGFAPLGHGALINCETIRHPEFVISIPAVKMGLALSNLQVDARDACSAAALQWAAALEGGQKRRDVVPGNITGAIVGGVRMGKFREMEHETRSAKAAAPTSPNGGKRMDFAAERIERAKALMIKTAGGVQ